MTKWLKWTLRVLLSGVALYLVFRKISWRQVQQVLTHAQLLWLIPALIGYNLSQWVSAERLYLFYRRTPVPLSRRLNLALYYKGMFYNLLLPGGIGGDGYKVHFLRKKYGQGLKKLIAATLLDRLNGLAALVLLLVLLSPGIHLEELFPAAIPFDPWWLVPLYGVGLVVAWLGARKYFPTWLPILPRTTLLSIGVQILQLAAVLCLMQAVHASGPVIAYLWLFLLSGIAAVIPFTIGGAGAREIVFMAGASLLGASAAQAIAVSLLFFLLSVLSAWAGAYLPMDNRDR
jgi:uncharacterized membrane protein YbhN (UPF0104 family)